VEINSDSWETISSDSSRDTIRLRVQGGWLVDIHDTDNSMSSVVFVPDPGHEWEIA